MKFLAWLKNVLEIIEDLLSPEIHTFVIEQLWGGLKPFTALRVNLRGALTVALDKIF